MKKRRHLINRNSVPFLILALIHFILLFPLIQKKRNKNTWILLLSNIGFAYLFEYFVLNLFKAYRYKPSVFKKRYFDNIFGAILSQGVFVPIASTFLTVFQKDWKWKACFSLFYFLIEKLFLRLKIYKENWWSPVYTFILILCYFILSDFFFKGLKAPTNGFKRVPIFISRSHWDYLYVCVGRQKENPV